MPEELNAQIFTEHWKAIRNYYLHCTWSSYICLLIFFKHHNPLTLSDEGSWNFLRLLWLKVLSNKIADELFTIMYDGYRQRLQIEGPPCHHRLVSSHLKSYHQCWRRRVHRSGSNRHCKKSPCSLILKGHSHSTTYFHHCWRDLELKFGSERSHVLLVGEVGNCYRMSLLEGWSWC